MKNSTVFFSSIFLLFSGYYSVESSEVNNSKPAEIKAEVTRDNSSVFWQNTVPSGKTVEARLPVPTGFQRLPAQPNSISNYLRKLPVKPHGSLVHLYDGSEKDFQ